MNSPTLYLLWHYPLATRKQFYMTPTSRRRTSTCKRTPWETWSMKWLCPHRPRSSLPSRPRPRDHTRYYKLFFSLLSTPCPLFPFFSTAWPHITTYFPLHISFSHSSRPWCHMVLLAPYFLLHFLYSHSSRPRGHIRYLLLTINFNFLYYHSS